MTEGRCLVSTLDNFRKEAKRWLKALRANDPDAQARLKRAYPKAPAEPGLRAVQHALALEHGAATWQDLKAGTPNAPSAIGLYGTSRQEHRQAF